MVCVSEPAAALSGSKGRTQISEPVRGSCSRLPGLGLSISGVKDRLRRLRARGDVRAYVALINPAAAGYAVCAFVKVAVEGTKNEQAFVRSVLRLAGVEECHRVSGEFPFFLKIWARDLENLELRVDKEIKTLGGWSGRARSSFYRL